MRRPNVLLIQTDQQRWDALGAAGNPYIHTPNLDRLAASGALMENAFCNNPVCMPSRQSMLSGLYPSALGCNTNGVEMSENTLTLQKVLQLVGYYTANIGKLHFKNHSNRDHREYHPAYNFDTLILSDEPGCYDDAYIKWVEEKAPEQVENCRVSTPPVSLMRKIDKQPRNTHEPYIFEGPEELTHSAFVAEETVEFIRQQPDGGRPFFAIAGFYAPHAPLNPPKRFVEMYEIESMPEPHQGDGEGRPDLADVDWKKVKAYYYALVSHVDCEVGKILDALDETGLRDNTLIIFTSDHGEHLGDHCQVQKGPPGFDSCIHVPLIFSLPGKIEAGKRFGELVELVDLAPTVLDFCGIQTPPEWQGKSLRALLEGREFEARDSVFFEFHAPYGTSTKGVRTHEYKYIATNGGQEHLYDLTKDPHELVNLAETRDAADLLHAGRAELLKRLFDVEAQFPRPSGAY
ncbi:MAG: sulfatase [Candidatus Sumerlaeia bacterium]